MLKEFAKQELSRAFPDMSDGAQQVVIKDVLALIDTFAEQNHSGFSAGYVMHLFDRLARFLPVSPLTGEEEEWGEPWGEDRAQQNKRCPQVFRYNFDNATAVDIEGRVFVGPDGMSYHSGKSRVPITFPYSVPDRPERVTVLEEMEIGGME